MPTKSPSRKKKKVATATDRKHVDALYRAAADYIENMGGKAVVLGGISIMEISKFRFELMIGVTGKPPTKKHL